MSDEDRNIELAIKHGWIRIYRPEIYENDFIHPDGRTAWSADELPNYLESEDQP